MLTITPTETAEVGTQYSPVVTRQMTATEAAWAAVGGPIWDAFDMPNIPPTVIEDLSGRRGVAAWYRAHYGA
jgi:hypothetical protein